MFKGLALRINDTCMMCTRVYLLGTQVLGTQVWDIQLHICVPNMAAIFN